MKKMIPSEYPPEGPAILAGKLKDDLMRKSIRIGIILGPKIPQIIKTKFRSRENTLDISEENRNQGFSYLDTGDDTTSLVFENTHDDRESSIESNSIVLHTCKWLEIEKIVIVDVVELRDESDESFFRIDDHINLTGINPLKYWMMNDEPEPFFLDTKNMYEKTGLERLPGLIHVAIYADQIGDFQNAPDKSMQYSMGDQFLPESILVKYLGMNISCIGCNGYLTESDMSQAEILLNLIKSL